MDFLPVRFSGVARATVTAASTDGNCGLISIGSGRRIQSELKDCLRAGSKLACGKDGRKIVEVYFGVVSVNFQDFRHESNSWAAFELDDDVERVADVGLDSAIGQFDAALENAARESRYCLLRGTGVDG